MDKALGTEAGQQPLRHPLLEMQMDGLVVEAAGVLEHDGSEGSVAAPVGNILVDLARCSQGVEGRNPAWIGGSPLFQRGEGPGYKTLVINILR